MSTVAVILAAGLGTRMKSRLPKVLHPILGDPSLLWVLRALPHGLGGAILVIHHGKQQVLAALDTWQKAGLLPCPLLVVDQGEPLGTGHALQVCIPELDRLGATRVAILCGDVPLTSATTASRLCGAETLLLAMDLPTPGAYGRVIQHPDGRLAELVEAKDATPEQLAVRRVNGGAYALPWPALRRALMGLSNHNAQNETYLTDAVVAVAREIPVTVELCDPEELAGMNSRHDQATLQAAAQRRIQQHWMTEGVSFLHPDSTLVGPRVVLQRDVLLEPCVRIEGSVQIGEGCRIGQGTVITDSVLGEGVEVRPYCVIEQALVGPGSKAGPCAVARGHGSGRRCPHRQFCGNQEGETAPRRQGQPPGLPRRHRDRRGHEHRRGRHNLQLLWREQAPDHHRPECLRGVRHPAGGPRGHRRRGPHRGRDHHPMDVPADALALSRTPQRPVKAAPRSSGPGRKGDCAKLVL